MDWPHLYKICPRARPQFMLCAVVAIDDESALEVAMSNFAGDFYFGKPLIESNVDVIDCGSVETVPIIAK